MKKLALEDANDKHKSLDFGLESVGRTKRNANNKGTPEMTVAEAEKTIRHGHGQSLDVGSPYLLPPELENSRESLHSMSRSVYNDDDKYRPATTLYPNDSMKSMQRRSRDDSSSFTGSSKRSQPYGGDEMGQNLLRNAQRMSRSDPLTVRSSLGGPPSIPQVRISEEQSAPLMAPVSPSPGSTTPELRINGVTNDGAGLKIGDNHLGSLIDGNNSSVNLMKDVIEASHNQANNGPPSPPRNGRKSPPPAIDTSTSNVLPPRLGSMHASVQMAGSSELADDESDYGDNFNVVPPSPTGSQNRRHSIDAPMPRPDSYLHDTLDASELGFDPRRLSMGFRPLPPEDPTDNPEQRANRIRSFYKEYFDDSKPGPQVPQAIAEDNYYGDVYGDGAIYDPASGQYVMPYAEPLGRRAMTPPPRAPPRFRGQDGHLMPPGPRAFSSASGRNGPGVMPKKALPPPAALKVLPTPHKLKDEDYLPIDFAPPDLAKAMRSGRPASPLGGSRPYSPALPAHTPLASSFDDLAVMPSPYVYQFLPPTSHY